MNKITARSPQFDDISVNVELYWTRDREITFIMDGLNHDRLMSLMGAASQVDFHVDDSAIFIFKDALCHKRVIAGKVAITFVENFDL